MKNNQYIWIVALFGIGALLIGSVVYLYVRRTTHDTLLAVFCWAVCAAVIFIPFIFAYNAQFTRKRTVQIQQDEHSGDTDIETGYKPTLFSDKRAIILLDGLVRENFLTEGYHKKEGTQTAQLAYIVATVCDIINTVPKWKEFEEFWNVHNLRQSANTYFVRGTIVANKVAIDDAIQAAGDSSLLIKDMDKFIRWKKARLSI